MRQISVEQRLEQDITYFKGEERRYLSKQDGCGKYTNEYKQSKGMFGVYYRARIMAEKELTALIKSAG